MFNSKKNTYLILELGAIIALCVNLITQGAALPQPVEKYDLVTAELQEIGSVFTLLQNKIITSLQARPSTAHAGLYNVTLENRHRYNLSINSRPNKLIQPHISLKTLPYNDANYTGATQLLKEEINRMVASILRKQHHGTDITIRLSGLLAISGIRDPNKIFITVTFHDSPANFFEELAYTLDRETHIARQEGFLPHITLVKFWPISQGSGVSTDQELLKDIQYIQDKILAPLWQQLMGSIANKRFNLTSINYDTWTDASTSYSDVRSIWKPQDLATSTKPVTIQRPPAATAPAPRSVQPAGPLTTKAPTDYIHFKQEIDEKHRQLISFSQTFITAFGNLGERIRNSKTLTATEREQLISEVSNLQGILEILGES